jgi:hypothetical protein
MRRVGCLSFYEVFVSKFFFMLSKHARTKICDKILLEKKEKCPILYEYLKRSKWKN